MIPRYETSEMSKIWSLENQYRSWMKVEIAVCKAWSNLGVIPVEAYRKIEKKSDFNVEQIGLIEAEVHHDVIAFVTDMANHVGPDGRYIHLGLTSSDVVDTAGALRLKESMAIIIEQLDSLTKVVWDMANKHKYTPCVGRSHGVHAEPTTFGLKMLNWYSELLRDRKRLDEALDEISYGKLSGAVGTYSHSSPEFEEKVCEALDLKPEPVSTQIVPRDKHAQVSYALSSLGCTMERISVEIRHLQRTEVREVLEPFGKKQKGSSAMPHKKNPILCERISGMARLLRGYLITSLENVALWHERDISHSSVERIIWPDSFHLTHYMLKTLERVVSGMVVDDVRMEYNLNLTRGLVFSQRVLLQLVEKFDLAREEAYSVVQENAMKCWDGDEEFIELLWKDDRINSKISRESLEGLFSKDYYYRHVDTIFSRFS